MIAKTDFDAKLSSANRKNTQNKTKHLLVEDELNKFKTFDSSYFIGKSHFEEEKNVKWKGCNNSFNSWINKKDLV